MRILEETVGSVGGAAGSPTARHPFRITGKCLQVEGAKGGLSAFGLERKVDVAGIPWGWPVGLFPPRELYVGRKKKDLMHIDISCPYHCQYDNTLYPGGSCNMTSAGMVLAHYGKDPLVPGSLPRVADRLLKYCDDHGMDRHELGVIQAVLVKFGVSDSASFATSFDQLKAHLKGGNLAIVQGDFTHSGHVMVVRGFDTEKGVWYCNDPAGWGEPDGNGYFHYGGPNWRPGEDVPYPSSLWRAAAAPDGKIWCHLCSLKSA